MNDTLVSPLSIKRSKKSADYSTTGQTRAGAAIRLCDQLLKATLAALRKSIEVFPHKGGGFLG
jgi:hypothetical protein